MTRLEQFQSHLLADASLSEFVGRQIVVGALRDTPLPAIAINWLNQPYGDDGLVVLDAEEPTGPMNIQVDGWVQGSGEQPLDAARDAKTKAKELAELLRNAIAAYGVESCQVTRDNVLCANQNGDRRRVSIEIEMTTKQALIGAGG